MNAFGGWTFKGVTGKEQSPVPTDLRRRNARLYTSTEVTKDTAETLSTVHAQVGLEFTP